MKTIFKFILSIILCTTGTIHLSYAQEQFKIRAWQFHDYNVDYIEKTLKIAPQYGINTVVFSHNIMWYTEEMFYDHYKPSYINLWSEKARRIGMKAWIWTHELNDIPEQFLTAPPKDPQAKRFSAWLGKVHPDFDAGPSKAKIDNPDFWEWIAAKYRKLFTILPEVDGMILSLHETPYRIFDDSTVVSKMSQSERVAKLVEAINTVCREYHKTLVVRTFVLEPDELDWVYEGLEKSPRDVIVMTKDVPHDWYPFLPHDPLLGRFKNHTQILEVGTNAENGGMNYIPYQQADYIKYRVDYSRSKGVQGYVARLDTKNRHVLGTPNEVSLYAMKRFTEDPALGTDSFWKEWAVLNYGEKAAPFMIRALRPSFDGVNKMFFFLGMWLTDHSRIPPYDYAVGHISSRSPAKWEKNSKYKPLEDELNRPTEETLEKVLAEKDDAIRIQAGCKAELEKAKEHLSPDVYSDLSRRFDIWRHDAETWRAFAEAFFAYRVFEETKDKTMLYRSERAVDNLEKWAKVTANTFGDDVMEDNPGRTLQFVKQLNAKITAVKK